MNQLLKGLLIRILSVIEFGEDKDKFIDSFIKLCFQQTVLEMLSGLPEEKQQTLNQFLTTNPSQQEVEAKMSEYFSAEDLANTFNKVCQVLLTDYIQSLLPSLDQKQVEELQLLLTQSQEQLKPPIRP